MPTRLVLGGLAVLALLAACEQSADESVDGGSVLTDGDVGGAIDDAGMPPDAWEPDLTPPSLMSVAPATGGVVWLHAPIRLMFDEPLDGTSVMMNVSATLAGTPVPAQLAFDPPSTLVVTLDAAARGIGAVDVHLTGSVNDLSGNASATPIDLAFVAPAWASASIDRGYAASPPQLAVTDSGIVYAAWIVGSTGSRRAVASVLAGDTWLDLGGALGGGDVTSVAITLDGAVPILAWTDGGVAHVAQWTGSWDEYTSPGAANFVALTTPPSGAPLLALFGATAGVRELTAGSWQPLGPDIAVPSTIARSASLAAGAPSKPAIGWIDASAQLRVYRFDAGWTPIAPLAVSPASRMSLAARGTSLAIAWDQLAGSYGVLAATLSGTATTFTRLGRALDIDIIGNAVAPAIAFDAGGAPLVAWTELVETNERGALARWNGSAWTVVGGVSWLDDAQAVPTGSRIALHADQAPVIATSAAGAIRIARFNGPRVAAAGITTRASMAGCSFSAANPPALLSQTGCFNVATPKQPVPHAGLIPFDVVDELWSDGAKKRRYIGLPDGAGMSLTSNGSWAAPVGTLLIKQFDLETTPGNPTTRRPVETRFLVNDPTNGWSGFTYRWNNAGTDASLLTDGLFTVDWTMDDGSTHQHQYPSRAHCRSCHHTSMGPLLGVRSEQLARWNDYNGVIADQLQTLSAIGVAPVSSATPFVSHNQPGATVEQRVRGYMAGNCAHCHNANYLSIRDLRYTTPLAQTGLCSSIQPGNPSGSQVYQLVTSRPGMPCLGSIAVDPLAQDLFATWISGMTSCP